MAIRIEMLRCFRVVGDHGSLADAREVHATAKTEFIAAGAPQ